MIDLVLNAYLADHRSLLLNPFVPSKDNFILGNSSSGLTAQLWSHLLSVNPEDHLKFLRPPPPARGWTLAGGWKVIVTRVERPFSSPIKKSQMVPSVVSRVDAQFNLSICFISENHSLVLLVGCLGLFLFLTRPCC